jgi:ABC-type uncharacterized transport system permease subunit
MSDKTKHSEPLIRISKRDGLIWWKSWLVRVAAVALALVLCSVIIILITGYNPVQVYYAMIRGSFGTARKFWIMLQNLAMLLCISLAVTPAFKMRFWNIGAEGQVLVGGLATAAVMFYVGDRLPTALMIVIMLAASLAAGIIWAMIPAFFKAKWNTNETLFTLMMNYVATQLVSFFIMIWVPSGSSVMGIINQSSKAGWLPELFGQKYLLNIIIVAVITVAMFIYLKYSKQGYEISVVGESENTARYIGINVKKVILRTMGLSGAICGVAGFLLVAGTNHTITTTTAGGMGFTAIMVSWLGKFNAGIMVVTSFIIVFLQRGAGEIATKFNLNQSVADILTGIILFFIIGCEFFVNYRINFRKSQREGK